MSRSLDALAPCPFCGSAPRMETTTAPDDGCHCVCCEHCEFSLMGGPVGIGWWPTKEVAAEAWNRRHCVNGLANVLREVERKINWRHQEAERIRSAKIKLSFEDLRVHEACLSDLIDIRAALARAGGES